jgi:plasmid rolling circle replication initiator protein Rep
MNTTNHCHAGQGVEEAQNAPTEEILSDPRPNGKERPWVPKKVNTVYVAASFERLGQRKRAARVCECGTCLDFEKSLETGVRRLVAANFCKIRLCPMCSWRRSLRSAYVLSSVMDVVEKEHPRLIPLFMTLTVQNCPGTLASLTQSLGMVFGGWNRLLQVKRVKSVVKGWFRALEVTYDGDEFITSEWYAKRKRYCDIHGIKIGDRTLNYDTFHPHIHAVIYVDKSYFQIGGSGAYIKTSEWVRLWRQSCRLNYDPVCDVRRVKNTKERKHINELSKYTVKDSDYITTNDSLMDRLVSILSKALHQRRLSAFGGVLKQLAKRFKSLDKESKEDLIHIGDGTIRADVATVIERFVWRFDMIQYVKIGEFRKE